MYKNITYKILSGLCLVFLAYTVVYNYQKTNYPEHDLRYYYKIIKNQEKVLSGEEIKQQQLVDLQNCGEDFKCFLRYYENYNASTTLQKSFSNLSLLLRDHPEYTIFCHQITHGIGHSELNKNNGDLGKSLQEFESGKYFTNIATCGSGYFHGLIEQAAKDIQGKDNLAKFFTDICYSDSVKKVAGSDCIHGLGHSSFLHLDYNLDHALYVCETVAKDDYEKFNCFTGVYMEMNLDYAKEDILSYDNNNYNFKICDVQETDLRKRACYFESVLQFGNLTNKKNDFLEMSKLCQTIPNEVYKLGCVKNIAIRSTIDVQFTDIQGMCFDNTRSSAQRIFCVTNFAHRVALSIDPLKGLEYSKISSDICKYLNQTERKTCNNLINSHSSQIYFLSEKDLYI